MLNACLFLVGIKIAACQATAADFMLSSVPHPFTQDAAAHYVSEVAFLVDNPKLIDTMPPAALQTITLHLYGFYIRKKLPQGQWPALRTSEAKLIYRIIVSLSNRVDSSIPTNSLSLIYPRYDDISRPDDPDHKDPTKRKAYDDFVARKMDDMPRLIAEQVGIKNSLQIVVEHARHYLSKLFSDEYKQGDDELREAGYDQKTIDLLIPPLKQ